MFRKHMTADVTAEVGQIVLTECGKWIARRSPDRIKRMKLCRRCEEKAAVPSRFTYTYKVHATPWTSTFEVPKEGTK